jgi:hypothetical protein
MTKKNRYKRSLAFTSTALLIFLYNYTTNTTADIAPPQKRKWQADTAKAASEDLQAPELVQKRTKVLKTKRHFLQKQLRQAKNYNYNYTKSSTANQKAKKAKISTNQRARNPKIV